jgi:UrcA family protein
MTNKIALLGSALIGAALLGAPAMAQYYDADSYLAPRTETRVYEAPTYTTPAYTYQTPAYDVATETVIVRPDYEFLEKHQLVGNINGEHNPTEFSLSRPVSFGDLNLADASDRQELRERIRDTAADLCYQLDARVPQLRGDRSADRECIREATRDAMRDALYGRG